MSGLVYEQLAVRDVVQGTPRGGSSYRSPHNGPNSGAKPTPSYMATSKHRPQGLQDTTSTENPGYDLTDAGQDMDASEPTCTG